MAHRLVISCLALSFVIALGLPSCRKPDDTSPPREIVISAASDLQFAFADMGRAFEQQTGCHPVFNFGSSGQLAHQIAAGASVDVFASANREYVTDLKLKGLIDEGTDRPYARGRITIWTRADSSVRPRSIAELERSQVQRIAIANPAHAPYGIAAREALVAAGIWERVQPKLIIGENIRDTLRYAETGAVDVAVVALSLAVGSHGEYTVIPESFHAPIIQALAVTLASKRPEDARAFAKFVTSKEGMRILARYGFEHP